MNANVVTGFPTPMRDNPVWFSTANRIASLLRLHGYRVVPESDEQVRVFDELQAGIVALAGSIARTLVRNPGSCISEMYLYEHSDEPGCVIVFSELSSGHMYATSIPSIRRPMLGVRAPLTLH
ncbi:hypothetical protein ABH945_001780 [Paraburkholderia sp. GAS333]|uniref:hypothetical protein n=1 Tax=Paraburkholderia sp. GAS333 TaxID=3156279 RepID=UPI003D20DEEF